MRRAPLPQFLSTEEERLADLSFTLLPCFAVPQVDAALLHASSVHKVQLRQAEQDLSEMHHIVHSKDRSIEVSVRRVWGCESGVWGCESG
eukprot:195754-Chlamydomonas_euryale.AAC.1